MALPSPRNKILPLRGLKSALDSNLAEILEGEICYATDEDQYYQKEGGVLVSVGATKAQGALADTALQPGDGVSELTNDAGYVDAAGAAAAAPVQSVAGKTGAVSLVKGDVGLGNVDNTSDANKPVSTAQQAALDAKADLVGGVIPNSQLPSLAISEYLGTVASEAAMLALTGQRGDWAIRTDTGSTWVITTDGGSLISDWTELATPADAVTSVNGYQGTVVLSAADVGAIPAADQYWDRTGTVVSPTNAGDDVVTTGRIGVGTASPSETLTLNGPAGASIGFERGGTEVATISNNQAALYVHAGSGNLLSLGAGGAEKARLSPTGVFTLGDGTTNAVSLDPGTTGSPFVRDSSGRLGVGTTSPTAKLTALETANTAVIQIKNAATDGQVLQFGLNSATGDAYVQSSSEGAGTAMPLQLVAGPGNDGIHVDTSGRLLVGHTVTPAVSLDPGTTGRPLVRDSNGNVGVKTATPIRDLSIGNGTTDVIVNLQSGNSQFCLLDFGDVDNSGSGRIGYLHNVDAMTFRTSGSGEDMRLDSAGRLLVGTATDLLGQQVQSCTTGGNNFGAARYDNGKGGAELILGHSRGGTVGSNVALQNDDVLGGIEFRGVNDTAFTTGAVVQARTDGTPSATSMPGRLQFFTTPSGSTTPVERMRITNSGDTCIFAATRVLQITTAAAASSSAEAVKLTNGASGVFTGPTAFQIMTNGDVKNTNNSYGAISDIKLKENIVDAKSQWDDIKGLRLVNYNFKAETGHQTHTQLGLIAQEVELVSPGLIGETPDLDENGDPTGEVTKSVNYSVLYMKAVGALQEAMAKIEDLQARVDALENA